MTLPTLGGAMAALSVATDFAMAQSAHFGMRSCVLSVRLAEVMGWRETQARQAYFQALLRYIGCNVESEIVASMLGDEMVVRREFAGIDAADRGAVASMVVRRLREANAELPTLRLAGRIVSTLLSAEKTMERIFSGHCDVDRRLAARIGFDESTVVSLGQLYERWDGKGLPLHLRGEAVSPAALLVTMAQDIVVHHDAHGADAAVAVVKSRQGKAYATKDLGLPGVYSLLYNVLGYPAGVVPVSKVESAGIERHGREGGGESRIGQRRPAARRAGRRPTVVRAPSLAAMSTIEKAMRPAS